MNFQHYLIDQAVAHPASQPQDIIKQCYQAAYGAEHLLSDMDRAHAYLEREYASLTASDALPLWEPISPQVCRVNLAAWKRRAFPLDWLFRMFVASASISVDRQQATDQFLTYLNTADALIQTGNLTASFPAEEWSDALSAYKNSGMTAVHHSDTYRQAEHPAYRIIRYEYVRLLPILEAVAKYFHKHSDVSALCDATATSLVSAPCIIAIDGRAASGKTTMADQLSQILGADVIHMDDFFLPPELRTAERLQNPGGNVHYERFIEEVLSHLKSADAFSYHRFDCHIMNYNGARQIRACIGSHPCIFRTESATVTCPIRIVEGSYSHHPALGDYSDIRVFSHVEPDKQMTRILHRNGPQMAQMFEQRWIPMEETYIQTYDIDTASQIVIDSTDLF